MIVRILAVDGQDVISGIRTELPWSSLLLSWSKCNLSLLSVVDFGVPWLRSEKVSWRWFSVSAQWFCTESIPLLPGSNRLYSISLLGGGPVPPRVFLQRFPGVALAA